MPACNGEAFIAAALASVRDQQSDTNLALEIIVVDDGSTDHTREIVRSFSETMPLRILTPGRLGNWVAATNMGLREATGDWACFLHQDDLWLPGRLKRLQRAMENAEGSLILHNAIYVNPQGRRVGPWTCPLPAGLVPSTVFIERLLVQNFIAIPSPVFRRNAVIDSGGLNEALWFSADWDLWLRLGRLGPVHFIHETLSAFRIHPASQTAARKLSPNEWDHQLTTVLAEHLQTWSGSGRLRVSVEQAARASIAVNSVLAAASRGEAVKYLPVVRQLLALGPLGWRRHLRDSRILQRVGARLKVQRQRKT
jgi:glycosyltransferase involved in cell wall biosynthesis